MIDKLYHYRAEVTKAYDGDTLSVDIDLGFGTWLRNQPVRLQGINTPEVRGKTRLAGIASRDALRKLVLGKKVILHTVKDKKEKYGRWLGIVYFENDKKELVNLNEWMVTNGFAQTYMV